MRLVKTAEDAYDIVNGNRVLGEVAETVGGRWMVLINGFQWGRGEPDRAGAYNETFETPEDALNAYRAFHNPHNRRQATMRPIDSSYDRAAFRAEIAARQALDAMRDGSTLPYDHPLIQALDDMAWGEIRDQIEEVPGEGWKLCR